MSDNQNPNSFNKSLGTNLVAAAFVVAGFLLPEPARKPVLSMGLFALSGALTNWIAIHMLFEKVPGFYGSGIIPLHFEEFKAAIHNLMMEQFFNEENVNRLFDDSNHSGAHVDFDSIIDETDFTPAFDALSAAVMESQFGSMLGMFGGKEALKPLKGPFAVKMKSALKSIASSESFQATLRKKLADKSMTHDILDKVDQIVTARLDELTPQMVKEIIQKMIREHLGWLVVWGGVFGGLIGLLASMIQI